MNLHDRKWMSAQELRIMRVLEQQGAKSQRELRLMIPPTDQRTPQVLAASVSRSLRRLMDRGLVERYRRRYVLRTPG